MAVSLYKHFNTSQQLNEQYDIEASVEDFGAYVTQFVEGSRAVRETVPSQLDVPYGPTLSETLDVFFPQQAAVEGQGRPAVFFVHGGYWKATSSKEWSYVAKGLSALGVVTVVENYALCPNVSIDEIVRQHRAAFSFIWRNAERFGIDRKRIVLVGHSAGAHGVAELLGTDWPGEYGLPAQPYVGAVAVSGVYDLRPLPHTFLAPELGISIEQAEALSPHLRIPTNLVPLLLPYGLQEPDEFQRQTVDYAAACAARSPTVELMALAFDHFNILDELAEGTGPIVNQVLEWLSVVRSSGSQ